MKFLAVIQVKHLTEQPAIIIWLAPLIFLLDLAMDVVQDIKNTIPIVMAFT